ncbi:MAG TPA: hypothetical protein VF008_13770 [Niastella sp.]
MKKEWFILILLITQLAGNAQKNDTIRIQSQQLDTRVLIPGTHRWLIYFKMGKDSSRTLFHLWTRNIDMIKYHGKDAICISQEWENDKQVIHTAYSVCDRKTFAPLLHEFWWLKSGEKWSFDFVSKEMKRDGVLLNGVDTSKAVRDKWKAFDSATQQQYVLNWHLDLETFPLLPFKENATFLINYYDPGFPAPSWIAYTVTGSAKLAGFNNQEIDCWIMEHKSQYGLEKFWISKKTREVLKLEQEFGGRFRYKIKLGFSI